MSDIVEQLRLRAGFSVAGMREYAVPFDSDLDQKAAARIVELEEIGDRLWLEQREIRSEVPRKFLLVPPDGGDVKTYEAVRAMTDEITRLRAENESLKEALKPFADMCDEIESCAAEYPADHPASDPENWFTGSFEWPDLLRARSAYEGEK